LKDDGHKVVNKARAYEFSLSERSGPSTLQNTGTDDLEFKQPKNLSKISGDVNKLD
jgi:hypothetical protein